MGLDLDDFEGGSERGGICDERLNSWMEVYIDDCHQTTDKEGVTIDLTFL